MRTGRFLAVLLVAASVTPALAGKPLLAAVPAVTVSGGGHHPAAQMRRWEARCEPLRDLVLARATDPSGSAGREEQGETVEQMRKAYQIPGAAPGDTCATTIVRELAAISTCGSAAELITSAAAIEGVFDAATVRDTLATNSRCARAVVAGVASVPRAEPEIVDAVLDWSLRQHDAGLRDGGLTVAGSLAHTAHVADDEATAAKVDTVIATELGRGRPGARTQLLEAAGNAGCAACVSWAAQDLGSASPETRLAAVAAFRFVTSPAAAMAMCGTLMNDSSPTVREQAGWSLRWERSGIRDRVACLVTSVAKDPSPRVREMAAQSLSTLAGGDTFARSALLHLQSDEYDVDVRDVATSWFDHHVGNDPLVDDPGVPSP
jgi:hypothetical protein